MLKGFWCRLRAGNLVEFISVFAPASSVQAVAGQGNHYWKFCGPLQLGSAFNREIKRNSKQCKTSATGENGKVAVKSSMRQMFSAGEQNVHK